MLYIEWTHENSEAKKSCATVPSMGLARQCESDNKLYG